MFNFQKLNLICNVPKHSFSKMVPNYAINMYLNIHFPKMNQNLTLQKCVQFPKCAKTFIFKNVPKSSTSNMDLNVQFPKCT